MTAIQNRYDLVYLFDISNGNPNGDPDAGNMPRIELQSQKGLVTDVSLKRKIRNYVALKHDGKPPFRIYMQEAAILNNQHQQAYDALELKAESKKLPKDVAKARELTAWMCRNFYDIRTFGAVMTTEVNAGQVRGPVQFGFAESIEAIVPQEITITRSSVTNERDAHKERTMGRKHIIPYALYRAPGFISANLAGDETKGTGFSEDDLQLLYEALYQMFEHDRSAARGFMSPCKLFAFRHASPMGNAPAHRLFETVKVWRMHDGEKREPGPHLPLPQKRSDYLIEVDHAKLPKGVEVIDVFKELFGDEG